jgi:hypothetical protein
VLLGIIACFSVPLAAPLAAAIRVTTIPINRMTKIEYTIAKHLKDDLSFS